MLEDTLKDHLVQPFAGKGAWMRLSSTLMNHFLENYYFILQSLHRK